MLSILVVLLFLGGVLICRATPVRFLSAERRLQALAAGSVLSLILLRLAEPPLDAAILTGTDRAFYLDLAMAAGGLVAALVVGLAWMAVLDDSRPGRSQLAALLLVLGPLLIALLRPVSWIPILTLPVALRTGWARQVAEERRPVTTLMAILAFLSILLWPPISASSGSFWAPEGFPARSFFHLAQPFLLAQLGVLATRFLLGLIVGPRRIGRRLLVSHMLAGLVPVALTALFAILISLLALANFRASVATHLLRMQHQFSQASLERAVDHALDEMDKEGQDPALCFSPEHLPDLARRIHSLWPAICCWRPDTAEAPVVGSPVCIVVQTPTEGHHATHGVDAADPLPLPPPQAWLLRPRHTNGCGLIQVRGHTLHVTDHRLAFGDTLVAIQVIAYLPDGRVKALEERLGSLARIDESYTFTMDFEIIGSDSAAPIAPPGDAPAGTSPIRSGHVLVPASEWVPGREDPDRTGVWREIQIPVIGISNLADLVPAFPTGGSPIGYIPIIVFAATALVFVAVEGFAFFSALRMGRTIAQAVSQLRLGTDRLRRGDLSYRINLSGGDELAALGAAFNEMAAGLEEGQRVALEKERLEGEMALARRIQQRLLPGKPPAVGGLELAGLTVPAREVGGDYYDFLPLEDGKVLIVMADVSGKGAAAAILMSSLRASIHNMLPGVGSLADLARRLNRFVYASTDMTEFITFFCGIVDARSGRLTYVNAGHEQPYLLRRNNSQERLVEGGLMLGAFPDVSYTEASVQLNNGDLLFLFTDGLTEANDAEGRMYEEERVSRLLPQLSNQHPDLLLRNTLASVDDFVQGAEPSDDITLLAVRRISL